VSVPRLSKLFPVIVVSLLAHVRSGPHGRAGRLIRPPDRASGPGCVISISYFRVSTYSISISSYLARGYVTD
jgi:hypothetical protein